MRTVAKGLSTNDYLFILTRELPNENQTYIWVNYVTNDGMDAIAKQGFSKALMVRQLNQGLSPYKSFFP